jgi:hypothetical protein
MADSPEGRPGWRERRAQEKRERELRTGPSPECLHEARTIRSNAEPVDPDAPYT